MLILVVGGIFLLVLLAGGAGVLMYRGAEQSVAIREESMLRAAAEQARLQQDLEAQALTDQQASEPSVLPDAGSSNDPAQPDRGSPEFDSSESAQLQVQVQAEGSRQIATWPSGAWLAIWTDEKLTGALAGEIGPLPAVEITSGGVAVGAIGLPLVKNAVQVLEGDEWTERALAADFDAAKFFGQLLIERLEWSVALQRMTGQ